VRKVHFRRTFIVLIIAILFMGILVAILPWWQENKSGDGEQASVSVAVPEFELPQLPLTPRTMSEEQREAAIVTAADDAFNAAVASGQSEERAQIAAQWARQKAHNVFYHTQPTD